MHTETGGAAPVAVVQGFHRVKSGPHEGRDPVCERAAARGEGLGCGREDVAPKSVPLGDVEREQN